ncbi:MAG TPA: hypothetical protein VN033_00120 [Vulgatibacter sp.]|nr:hypothetical protein [Vulgatibacter sp.]
MRHFLPIVGLALAAACGDADGEGSIVFRISGEEAAHTGYPVPGDPDLAFVDGWTLRFDKYLVSVGNLRLEGADGETGWAGKDSAIVDLVAGEPEVFRIDGVAARRWERFSYEILPASAAAGRIGVSNADAQRMIAGGFNYLIEGTATKEGRDFRFSWGIANPTRNRDCIDGQDGSPGVVIRNNSVSRYAITLHLDHLFYDHLGDHDDADMRFDAIAAVAREVDGVLTIAFDDLEAQRLADLRDANGGPLLDEHGARIVYDPFSVPLDDPNLRSYLLAASRSQGRFNGEGFCANVGS